MFCLIDPLKDLHNYSSEMTISQIVKFFERKGIGFTKTMIQNYVRVGVLEPPDGRIYRARHLKALVLIDYLKQVYSLDEIKALFDAVDIAESYDKFLEMYASSRKFWNGRREETAGELLMLELAAFCAAAKRLNRELAHVE